MDALNEMKLGAFAALAPSPAKKNLHPLDWTLVSVGFVALSAVALGAVMALSFVSGGAL
ncbi:MAG: hypothetical protein AB1938_17260 [Myxococcota bacterium]